VKMSDGDKVEKCFRKWKIAGFRMSANGKWSRIEVLKLQS